LNLAAAFFVAAALAAGPVLYLYLRHALLTVLTLSVPLLGGIFWSLNADGAVAEFIFAAAAFGTVLFFLVAERMARAVCAGTAPRKAVADAVKTVVPAGALAVAAPLLPALAIGRVAGLRALAPASVAVILELAWLGAALWMAAVVPYTEDFIAAANRAREARQGAAAWFAPLAESRWALAVAGIAAMLATIALLRLRSLPAPHHGRVFGAAAAIVLFAAALGWMRDWRLAVAAVLSLAVCGLWLAGFAGEFRWPVLALALAAVLVPLAVFGRCWSGEIRAGAEPAESLQPVFVGEAPPVAMCAALILVLGLGWSRAGSHSLLLPLAGAWIALGLFAFAAFAIALHALLPRYRSVEDVFGKR